MIIYRNTFYFLLIPYFSPILDNSQRSNHSDGCKTFIISNWRFSSIFKDWRDCPRQSFWIIILKDLNFHYFQDEGLYLEFCKSLPPANLPAREHPDLQIYSACSLGIHNYQRSVYLYGCMCVRDATLMISFSFDPPRKREFSLFIQHLSPTS